MARSKRGEGPNKMGLVRDAMAALGGAPKPKELHEYIKTNNGVDIPTGMISSYKSMINKKGGKKKGRGRPPKNPGAGPGRPAGSSGGGSVSMSDITEVKRMVSKFGAGKLSDLIKLLS